MKFLTTFPPQRLAILVLALAAAAAVHAQAASKKELVQKLLALQQPGLDNLARDIASRPAVQMMQAAGSVLQTQVPADKREAVGKSIEAELKKYADDATVVVRERAAKLVPLTYGVALEEKFSDDELKQLIAWFESPVNRKFQQLGPEMQNGLVQKLVADTAPLLDPKLQALQQRVRGLLGLPAGGPASGPAPAAKPAAK
jgi:uncharacterized protein